MKIAVAKIVALKPDVVIVEKTVSRLALEFLLDANVSLVLNIKPALMHRIARCTRAVILPSTDNVDMNLQKTSPCGSCTNFRIHTYKGSWGRKTLLFVEGKIFFCCCCLLILVGTENIFNIGCPKELGCSILLTGGPLPVLQKVKSILLV